MQPISAMTQEISIRIDRGERDALLCALRIGIREFKASAEKNAPAAVVRFRSLYETLIRQEIQL